MRYRYKHAGPADWFKENVLGQEPPTDPLLRAALTAAGLATVGGVYHAANTSLTKAIDQNTRQSAHDFLSPFMSGGADAGYAQEMFVDDALQKAKLDVNKVFRPPGPYEAVADLDDFPELANTTRKLIPDAKQMLSYPEASGARLASPGAVLHEVGHLQGAGDSAIARMQRAALRAGFTPSRQFAAGAALGAVTGLSGHDGLEMAAPAVAVAPLLPTLLEEGRANLNARGLIREYASAKNIDPDAIRAAKGILPRSFATYGALGLGAAAVPIALQQFRQAHRDS